MTLSMAVANGGHLHPGRTRSAPLTWTVSPELPTGSPWHVPVMPAATQMHARPPRCDTSKTTSSGRRAKQVHDSGELHTCPNGGSYVTRTQGPEAVDDTPTTRPRAMAQRCSRTRPQLEDGGHGLAAIKDVDDMACREATQRRTVMHIKRSSPLR
jgi:hypothetical protein